MKVYADLSSLESMGNTLKETARDLERIRTEAEQQIAALLSAWQGSDSQALQEAFYAAGGLNEFSKRMIRGYLAFSDHFYDAKRTYMSVSQSLADAEAEASQKTGIL